MTTERQPQPRTQEQIDKRVPPEIWERIFGRLYPSQLTWLSMVNKNFNRIVSSLPVWSQMFSVAFGPTTMPEAKSYMLYMCASSLYICEECLNRTPYLPKYSSLTRKVERPQRPSPMLAPMPTLSKDNLKYLGKEVSLNWTIRIFSTCRSKAKIYSKIEVGDDEKTVDRIRWYREQN
ncbi:hypothetical protein BGZ68_001212 [Mortierella alpina]|nr:hypothetical protein BGZ68_001212 [Mortierella alpina]